MAINIKRVYAAILLLAAAAPALAQIAVSANDGKQRGADSRSVPLTADSIAILDLSRPVRVLAQLSAPASLIGPPASVAVARDSSFALVTAAQRLDASGTVVPADIVTVVDLREPAKPSVLQTLHAGKGASGVAIDPSGSLALVTNAGDDSISVFAVANRHLSVVDTLALPRKSKPLDIGFADDHTAYVVEQGANAIVRLTVDGAKVSVAHSIAVGMQPYSMAIDGQVAYVTNLRGRGNAPGARPGPAMGTIAVVDLRAGRMIRQVDVGVTPEHVALSPTGRYLEVTVINGSNAPRAVRRHDHGIMEIFRARGLSLEPVTQIQTGAWCQGATWSTDEKRVLLQCAARKQIEVYEFDGKKLIPDPGATLQFDARPGAIATARSR